MSFSSTNLAIGDWVVLTKEGAKAHRDYHRTSAMAGGAALGAVLLLLALTGGFLTAVGVIWDIQARWWGQKGHDYQVVWSNEEPYDETSWHLDQHPRQLESPLTPTEIPIT